MRPPQIIADLIDAPRNPTVSLTTDRRRLLLLEPAGLPSIVELAQPELRLAGLRINPRNHSPSRAGHFTGITVMEIATRQRRAVGGLPAGVRIGPVHRSPDGRRLAFVVYQDDRCELWLADLEAAEAWRAGDLRVNAAGGSPLQWHPDGQLLYCELVREDAGPPAEPLVIEPIVQENHGQTAPGRTFQDLLKNPHDEALLEHYLTAQLARVTLGGEVTLLGRPRMVARCDPSPDGLYLLVETYHRPFSYVVTLRRFPRAIEVWHADGRPLRTLAELPLAEGIPVANDAARPGPRAFQWRSDAAATLCWAEAQDRGDPAVPAEVRDKLYLLAAPFEGEPREWLSLGMRYHGLDWCDDDLALVHEGWWKTRRARAWIVRPGDPARPPELLFDRSTEDRYGDPGSPLHRQNAQGRAVIEKGADGESIFLVGPGATPEGSRPFLDRLHLPSRRATRLWQSRPPLYEWPVAFLDPRQERLFVGRETVDEPMNYHALDLPLGSLTPLTDFPHPTPQLRRVQKEVLRYRRPDGVLCTATLYLPEGYRPEHGPLPGLVWIYPREYKNAETAGHMDRSPHRFVQVGPSSPLLWLTQGYAVLDGPTLPIVGEGDAEPNDTYLEQLVAGAQAAVDEVVRRGVMDPGRLAIGGQSYGAFTVANLLAHGELFRAGIALSGAYNRTLTPFGFQSEERTLWEAPEAYARMSPFMQAPRIRRPLLLIHGQADENPGTYPLQSERFYQALKGHGATARLVLLPHEGHAYWARESLHRVAAEIHAWLEQHVRPAVPASH